MMVMMMMMMDRDNNLDSNGCMLYSIVHAFDAPCLVFLS